MIKLFNNGISFEEKGKQTIYKFEGNIDYESIKCVMDNYSNDTYLLTSKNNLNKILLDGISNAKISSCKLSFANDSQYSLNLNNYPTYNVSIVDTDEYLSIPNVNKGKIIPYYLNNSVTISLSTKEENTSLNIEIGLGLFKILLICNSQFNSNLYRCTFSSNDLIELIQKYSFVSVTDITKDSFEYKTIEKVFLILSFVLFVILVLFDIMSSKGLKTYIKRIKEAYQNNEISNKLNKGIVLFLNIFSLSLLVIICLLYPLNLYLCNLIPALINRNSSGTGLYSKMPDNPYFENIYNSIRFLTGNAYWILSIVFAIIISIVLYLLLNKLSEKIK